MVKMRLIWCFWICAVHLCWCLPVMAHEPWSLTEWFELPGEAVVPYALDMGYRAGRRHYWLNLALPHVSSQSIEERLQQFFIQEMRFPELRLQLLQHQTIGDHERWLFMQTFRGVPVLGSMAVAVTRENRLHYAYQRLFTENILGNGSDSEPPLRQQWAESAKFFQGWGSSFFWKHRPQPAIWKNSRAIGQSPWVYLGTLQTEAPSRRWDVVIEPRTGRPLARRSYQQMGGVQGHVAAVYEPSCAGETRHIVAVPFVHWAPLKVTNKKGMFASRSFFEHAHVDFSGRYFTLKDRKAAVGPSWTIPLQASPHYNVVHLGQAPPEYIDAYIHLNRARSELAERMLQIPELSQTFLPRFLAQNMEVWLNDSAVDTRCNAYFDGESLVFGGRYLPWQCLQSARSRALVYHEYGHAVQQALTLQSDAVRFTGPQLSQDVAEGMADFFHTWLTHETKMVGAQGCQMPLMTGDLVRDCNNHYRYCSDERCEVHPGDSPYAVAPVICGLFFDLRQRLMRDFGAYEAEKTLHRLYLLSHLYLQDVESLYFALILADADKGHRAGQATRHSCQINAAFFGEGTHQLGRFPDLVVHKVPCLSR